MNPQLERARDAALFAAHFVAALARRIGRWTLRLARSAAQRMSTPSTTSRRGRGPRPSPNTPGDGAAARAPRTRRSMVRSLVAWGVAVLVVYTAAAWSGVALGNAIFEDVSVRPIPEDFGKIDWKQNSTVHASNGDVIYSFAEEKRDLVGFDEISPHVVNALVAVEDAQFWEHRGMNPRGIARAAVTDVKASIRARELTFPEGGSSLTQQLAKLLFTNSEKTYKRKVQEAGYALRIEREYSKQDILEAYLNLVFLGHQRYGVEAASQFYFGKSAKDLTVPEAAMIAGLPQRPNALSPRSNPEAALKRRNHVIDRMAECGYITPEEAEGFKASPITIVHAEASRRIETQQAAPFFVEDVRRQLMDDDSLAESLRTAGGLKIETTLDMELQRLASRVLRQHLRKLDRELSGFRPIERNVLAGGVQPEDFEEPTWQLRPEVGDVVVGVVLAADEDSAVVRVGERSGEHAQIATVDVTIDRDAVAWTKRRIVSEVLHRGDLAPFRIVARDEAEVISALELEQDPQLEAALVALDVDSGEILAMVGGYDYDRSEFNKATQAWRQVGSTFKPIYYATALERGLRPSTTVTDEPTVFIDPWRGEEYAPENYYPTYNGRTTLREALEKSLNVASVRLLNYVGYEHAIDTAHRLGITGNLQPYPSLALGAPEVTLLEITSAYGAFPNGGLHVTPSLVRRVRGRSDEILFEHRPRAEQAMSPQTAFQMVQMLRGVVERGTAKTANVIDRPIAGKTGTTNDWSDAWFVGFSPSIVVGVWVGYEHELKSIGRDYAGAKAALPIWTAFMKGYFEGRPEEQFADPGGVDVVPVDRQTGLIAAEGCEDVFLEFFAEDNKPVRACSPSAHRQVSVPKCLQRFPMDENGVLVVPDEDLLFRMADDPAGECGMEVDGVQRVIIHGWAAGGVPREFPYRVGFAPAVASTEDSVESLMMADRRTTKRGDLSDFDVLEGKTVIVVRNE